MPVQPVTAEPTQEERDTKRPFPVMVVIGANEYPATAFWDLDKKRWSVLCDTGRLVRAVTGP